MALVMGIEAFKAQKACEEKLKSVQNILHSLRVAGQYQYGQGHT